MWGIISGGVGLLVLLLLVGCVCWSRRRQSAEMALLTLRGREASMPKLVGPTDGTALAEVRECEGSMRHVRFSAQV